MLAARIVNALLETDDIDRYVDRLSTGSVPDVLKSHGIPNQLTGRSVFDQVERKIIPIQNVFKTSFGDALKPTDQMKPKFIQIEVVAPSDEGSGNYLFWQGQAEPFLLRVQVFLSDFYIATSRDVRAGPRGDLASRLNHVLQALYDAIQQADGKYTDMYAFIQAVDKAWGRQQHQRTIRRKDI